MSEHDTHLGRIRVLADGIPFENALQRGIYRYCFEVLSRAAAGSCDVSVQLSTPPAVPLPAGCRAVRDPRFEAVSHLDLIGRVARKRRHLAHRRAVRGCDVFHSMYYAPAPADVPSVVTVYDMIVEMCPEHFPEAEPRVESKRAAVSAAGRVLTISAAAADDLEICYPGCRGKTVAVHLGADHFPAARGEGQPRGTDAYAVHVGERALYKNFRTLVESLASPRWPRDVQLKVVGRPFTTGETLLLERLGVTGRVRHLGRLADAELARVYAEAVAFVFPSVAEGFGLPLVEAQRCRCPVACSDIAVFREVAGDGATYFDPRSPADIAAAVDRCRDPALRRDLIDRGRANAGRFTWDRCARETVAVYRAVTGIN